MGRVIKLDENEAPYSLSTSIIEAARRGLKDPNRYPDISDIDKLRRMWN